MMTDEFIDQLIKCEKKICEIPNKPREDRGNLKINFTMNSIDDKYNFNGIIRQNLKFRENFSVGLIFNPREERGTIFLLRCNGPHGENNVHPHHIGSHIHKASSERIEKGLKPEGLIELTNSYTTLEEAIQFFVNLINLRPIDKQKYFPPPTGQIELWQ